MKSLYFLPLAAALVASPAYSIFIDGSGRYSLRGETRTAPGFTKDSGEFQAIEQFFRLDTEIRVSDDASFFMEFELFENERAAFLGDSPAVTCPEGADNDECIRHQNSLEPSYDLYVPRIRTIYAQYATDYCLLTVGRRPREWGMGLYLDAGRDKFDVGASVYDGVTCDINIQKSQTLGFSVGYDKITETGASVYQSPATDQEVFGSTNRSDDLDQIFFTLSYNDHELNANKGFSQEISFYFANIFGGRNTKADVKIADLYVNFLVGDLLIRNEFLFRLGESSDPTLKYLGGLRGTDSDNKVRSRLQAISAAGSFEYFLSRSGSKVGPEKLAQSGITSHSLFFDYAFAPGDSDGYYAENASVDLQPLRDDNVTAVAFNQNFKPALLLFNGKPGTDNLRVDGVFDPFRIMNTTVFSIGYRYQSFDYGNFEVKAITASLNESMPSDVRASVGNDNRLIGYGGTNLGVELDLSYEMALGQGFDWGIAGAIAQPGDAWKTAEDVETELNYQLQSSFSFSF